MTLLSFCVRRRAHDLVVVRVRGLVGSRGHLNYPLSDVVGDMARLMGMPLEDVVKEARGPGGVAQRRESVVRGGWAWGSGM